MTFLDKVKFGCLTILTLGIYPFVVLRKRKQVVATKLSIASKPKLDVKRLVQLMGTKKNIVAVEYTHTKIKIVVADRKEVKIAQLEKLKHVSGIFASRTYITLIVGNQAKQIAKLLLD